MGKWMAVNGESIYGTHGQPVSAKLDWGRCTQKPGKLYLHVFDWPKGNLVVPGLKNKVEKAYLLSDQEPETAADLAERRRRHREAPRDRPRPDRVGRRPHDRRPRRSHAAAKQVMMFSRRMLLAGCQRHPAVSDSRLYLRSAFARYRR